MRKNAQLLSIIIASGLAAVLLIAAISPQMALQEQVDSDSPQRTISVSGTGQVSVIPNVAVVTLGVQTTADEATKALTENSERMQALISVLEDADVASEDIQTQIIRLFPQYQDTPDRAGQPELVGYTATNTVEVRVRDMEVVGSILDAAVQAGGNRIESIRFEISDASAALDQARDVAWNDAVHKAEQLASLADAELDMVLSISESGRGPQPVVERALMAEAQTEVPIEPGSQTVQIDLQVTWLLMEVE